MSNSTKTKVRWDAGTAQIVQDGLNDDRIDENCTPTTLKALYPGVFDKFSNPVIGNHLGKLKKVHFTKQAAFG